VIAQQSQVIEIFRPSQFLRLNHALAELFPEKNLLDRQERVIASFDGLPDS
jgi:hypothetical protein